LNGWRNFGFTFPASRSRYFWIWSRRGLLELVAVRDAPRRYALRDVVRNPVYALVLVIDAVERFLRS